jgi:predicted dehydrogenase
MKITPSTRRQFLGRTSAAVAAFYIVPRHVLGGAGFVPPSEKINIALVGAGGMGRANLRQLFLEPDAQVTAVADAVESFSYSRGYSGAGGRLPAKALIEKHYAEKTTNFRCQAYEDFRVMLEKEKSVDAVLCATPDHLHAHVSVLAMQAGKHVYCEKPLAHDIWETRHVAKVARETGRASQMGNQKMSDEGVRQTVEHLWSGAIGGIREIHVWVSAGRYNSELTTWPAPSERVPAGFNWDLWLGPLEPRPFNPAYAPFSWRDFWTFGGGPMGDFGCHDLNAAVWAFDFKTPVRVEAVTTRSIHPEVTSPGAVVYFDFPASAKWPALRLTWYFGGLRPATPPTFGRYPMPGRGALYIGDKGVLLTGNSGGAPRLFPEARRQEHGTPPATIARSKGHHRDWLDACKGGAPAGSNFDWASRLTEIVHLGTLAIRTGKVIEWDATNMQARGAPEAEPLVRKSYRSGWELA